MCSCLWQTLLLLGKMFILDIIFSLLFFSIIFLYLWLILPNMTNHSGVTIATVRHLEFTQTETNQWNLRPCHFYKEYPDRPKDSEIQYILTRWHPVQIWRQRRKTFARNVPEKEKGNKQKRQMYIQILSKNELVIKAEEEEGEEKKKSNRMDMVSTEKRKGGEKKKKRRYKTTELLLNYQQIPLPCLRNKTNGRQKTMETAEREAKAER